MKKYKLSAKKKKIYQMGILELKNAQTKIKKKKNSQDKLSTRMKVTEEIIYKLEDRTIEMTQNEQQKENRSK